MVGRVLELMRPVAEAANDWLEGADGVMRLEVAPVRAQLSLPLTALDVLHASHTQLPHHRLSKGLRGELGSPERLAADRTEARSHGQLSQTVTTHGVA